MGFGEKLRIILELHDIKVYNLASYLGYDASYISKWMTGSKMPSSKHIRKINRDIGEFCAKEGTSAQKKETLAMLKSDIDYTNFDAYATAISKYLSDSDEISEITPPDQEIHRFHRCQGKTILPFKNAWIIFRYSRLSSAGSAVQNASAS